MLVGGGGGVDILRVVGLVFWQMQGVVLHPRGQLMAIPIRTDHFGKQPCIECCYRVVLQSQTCRCRLKGCYYTCC